MYHNKVFSLLITGILILFSTVSLAQNSNFEGQVKVDGEHEGTEYAVDYFLKGEKLRVEVQKPQNMVLISDSDFITMLMPKQNRYMKFPKDQVEQMQQMMGSGQKSDAENLIEEDMELQKTGETKVILGRECDKWTYEDDDKKVETWVTSGFGNFMGFTTPLGGSNADAWEGLFGDPDLFPMEITQWDKDGNQISKFEVTEMEQKSLSNDMFTPPSDYEEMNMMGRFD